MAPKGKIFKIGAHVSISGGLYKSIESAESIGANTFQIFGASARSWKTRLPDAQAVQRYKDCLRKSGLGPVFLHAPYLINLASSDRAIWDKSIQNCSEHLSIAKLLGATGLVVHVGSAKGGDRDAALRKTAEGIRQVLKNVPGTTSLIMENAGSGDKIGARIEDFQAIIQQVKSKRVKICFDTAHAFEAGWIEFFTPAEIKSLFNRLNKEAGEGRLVVIHANDSKTPFNSHHDRHENIGRGHIGLAAFKNLAKEKRLRHLPWILEVPGFEGNGPDEKNINLLKSCFK
jgi:deoxyribonuclease-4